MGFIGRSRVKRKDKEITGEQKQKEKNKPVGQRSSSSKGYTKKFERCDLSKRPKGRECIKTINHKKPFRAQKLKTNNRDKEE